MDNIVLLEVLGVLGAWAVAGYSIWRWGPGLRMRSVRCPANKYRARVVAEQLEAEFGCLRVSDVKACTLFPNEPLTCGKECMTGL